MGRTEKEIFVSGRNVDEIKSLVQDWFAKNKIDSIESNSSSIKGRWGPGVIVPFRYFQVTFQPIQGGVRTKTEGWLLYYGFGEVEFSQSGQTGIDGLDQRREGWRTMERLWDTLSGFSVVTASSIFCSNCGTQIDGKANFCANCGRKVTANSNQTLPPPQF